MELLEVYAHEFVLKAIRIGLSIEKLAQANIFNDDEHRINLRLQLEQLAEMCNTCELPMTKIRVDHVLLCLNSFDHPKYPEEKGAVIRSLSGDLLAKYLADIRERLADELSTKLFFQLPYSRKQLYEKPREKWEKVIDKFPETITDIEEMAKCFALSRYAASIFHSLLVVEAGLIRLGNAIGVADPKPGWDATSKKLAQLVNDGHARYPEHLPITFAVCEQINQSVQTMKHAWRNKVNHVAGKLIVLQSDFSPDIAEEIIVATRSFMRRLAADLP